MLKIFDNYYLDASGVCYMLKKAHVKGGSKVEYTMSVPTTPGWRRRWRKLCGVGSGRGSQTRS